MDRTCEVLSCSIVSCQIGRKVGTFFFVEEKAGVFTTNLSMSKFLSVFNERNYILPKNLQLRLFFTNIFSKRRQLCHHFSGVYMSACLCCTNRRRLVPRSLTCKIKPWTSNVYEIEGGKGFLAFFHDKSSLKCRIYAGISKKRVDLCFILWILCVLLWIMWFFVNCAIGCDLRSIVRNRTIA